ncbi:MAG: hypothetical protein ACKOCD_01720 [Nitrospiraceae bacterium]
MMRAGLSATSVLLLTIVHHVYGAIIYNTPWRMHIAHVAVPGILVLAGALLVWKKRRGTAIGTVALWVFVAVSAVLPIGWIGLFEGGYNHVVKDALYVAGAPGPVMRRLFPPPLYEMPNNLLFELTGAAQFPLALWAAYETRRLYRTACATNGLPSGNV